MLLLSSGKKVFNFLDFFGSEVSKNINFLDFFTRNIYSWNPLNVKNPNILTLANVFVNKKQMGTVYNTLQIMQTFYHQIDYSDVKHFCEFKNVNR